MSPDIGKPTTAQIAALRAMMEATRNVPFAEAIDADKLRAEMRRRAPQIAALNRFLGLTR